MFRIHRFALAKSFHLRFFSPSAAALIEEPAIEAAPLTYLEGLPKPGPVETILAIPRSTSGKSIAAKERKAGRVPSILFEQEDGQHGGNKRLISVQSNHVRNLVNKLGRSFFLSRLFKLEVRPEFESDEIIEEVRVLPRLIHLHSITDIPINGTFIRAPSTALLKVDVPLVFTGEDVSPGLRKGSYLNIIKRTVKFLCPADIIPPYIEVDLSELDVGQKLVMGDLKVHPALQLIQSEEQPVVKIMGARVSDQRKSK
ncbi:hypothetical protein P3X46_016784 [Hevea brasiliensis]|uniref:Ribosomal protein L25 beta domain-containing protein n=1 Tax=Hevea brasiliensis TaxID=3981 RepID=A0ABQ9M082_HEVBR|nr:uncharacterized protein LOC110634127 [Hevea brasiliensis]KAJ9173671.1 hypothetical protein P3X46_016784 [Hevea brasiliensis]